MRSRPFKRVLVANRGEIACRIISTLDRMGIESVAVYSDADRQALHVSQATTAVRLGPAPATESYLCQELVIEAALTSGAEAIHPGYGLLSESAEFAEACEIAGLVFIGPTPDQLRTFGLKHSARELAATASVALVPGSGLVATIEAATSEADRLGYPVMMKASAGGGGIGMRRCDDQAQVAEAFRAVARLAENNFGDASIFLERFIEHARHIEVQVFGDGNGRVITLGERDCSAQRRNQKVIEEAPAPTITENLRERLLADAEALASAVDYRSAGTIEFVVDADTLSNPDGGNAWFLEMNTRLQVEHGVTELTHGIDLVAWMIELAAGEVPDGFDSPPTTEGHAIEVRLYAEDPADNFLPSPGLITELVVPTDVRCDGWVTTGTEVSAHYDPLLIKLLVHAESRDTAIAAIERALTGTKISGIATNRTFLLDALASPSFKDGVMTTTGLDRFPHRSRTVKVIDGGLFTTVQDLPGRVGYWQVGVPPSGPMDDLSFRKANLLVGNDIETPALELTLTGPTLRFRSDTKFVLGGAEFGATLDGSPVPTWTVVAAPADSVLEIGTAPGPGSRGVLAVAGGFEVPDHLGSASTFVLGGFGGHGGRALRAGDVLAVGPPTSDERVGDTLPNDRRPVLGSHWEVGVLAGPHAAPDYFTQNDIRSFYATKWEVHFNSDRTGVRLVGPAPEWARPDGGEAGLHPSNIHDNPYAVGTVDFTGDMPIVLGRDGPSLGGFVCPATVASHEFWKIGQARAGDTIQFVPIDHDAALDVATPRRRLPTPEDPILHRGQADDGPPMVIRRDGDRNLLVEYGDNVLDLLLRLRVGALMVAIEASPPEGLAEMVPGIRSLQVGFDPLLISPQELVAHVVASDASLGPVSDLVIPSRIVHLPLSWDDPATRLATEKYMQTVRSDAPWCPWNIEFIRRINGLDSVEEVKRIVFDASYLVLGLGDVYLGAPVATPVDPRHRLVTTKYNPARTWTAENSVGIGGAYLCIYGMEGPGGYQFVGRTVPVWDRWQPGSSGFEKPWLLRFYDQIRWHEVDADELVDLRAEVSAGRYEFEIEETTFSVSDHLSMLETDRAEIERFTATRDDAFEGERKRWADQGIDLNMTNADAPVVMEHQPVPASCIAATASIPGVVWKVAVAVGDRVQDKQELLVLEAMKMETPIVSPSTGVVVDVRCVEGDTAKAGQALVIINPTPPPHHD